MILIDADRRPISVPAERFRVQLDEGAVLRVPMSDRGTPDWFGAVRDDAEMERLLGEAERTLEEMKKRNSGDDLEKPDEPDSD